MTAGCGCKSKTKEMLRIHNTGKEPMKKELPLCLARRFNVSPTSSPAPGAAKADDDEYKDGGPPSLLPHQGHNTLQPCSSSAKVLPRPQLLSWKGVARGREKGMLLA